MKKFSIAVLIAGFILSYTGVAAASQQYVPASNRPLPPLPARPDDAVNNTPPARPTAPLPPLPLDTGYPCLQCTKKTCINPRTMADCLQNCNPSEIPACEGAPLKIKNETDANYAGSINANKFLNGLYQRYSSIRYLLDQALTKKLDTKNPLTTDEIINLKNALNEVDKACQDIVTRITKIIKARKIGNFNMVKGMQSNMKSLYGDLLDQISAIKIKVNTKKSSRAEIKSLVDKLMLTFKNCFNQGEGVYYKVKNNDFAALEKKKCQQCTGDNCRKNAYTYKSCQEECPPKYLKSCVLPGA